MAQRRRIGILYQNNENWIGGTYYIQNLIAALKLLEVGQQPHIVLFAATAGEFEQIQAIGYPHLEYRPLKSESPRLSLTRRIVNKILNKLSGNDRFPQPVKMDIADLDALFPAPVGVDGSSGTRIIHWIPDFQELYYPQFFSASDIYNRQQSHRFIAKSRNKVVFSSENALRDFRRLFPQHQCRTSVMQFAVSHPPLPEFDAAALRGKYGLGRDFYIAPNQFWVHKNQGVIIEAARILKEKGQLNFQIAFTGKEQDYRYPDYAASLKHLVSNYGLEEAVKFLGFIDRMDQLQLIDCAMGLIQPSLFEGWSTVIEDGKALRKYIIASDLAVHWEQLSSNASFFKVDDPKGLAALMLKRSDFNESKSDYQSNIKLYACQFLGLVETAD